MKPVICFNRLSLSYNMMRKVLKPPLFLLPLIFMAFVIDSQGAKTGSNPVLPPVAICKNISVQLGTSGSVTITGSDVDGGSYDPDGTITNRLVSPSTFNCLQIGSNSVTLTVTDNEGLTSTCNATVTVEDRTPPIMMCKNFTVYLDASGNGIISPADINNGSTDNCPAGLFMYLSKTDFDCSDIGSPITVTLIGTDGSGNSSSCSSQVTVLDTVSPSINIKPYNLVLGSSGTGTVLVSDIDNGTFDNCGSVALSISQSTFTCADLGQKTITLTALDAHGNSSSRDVTINVSSTLNITGMSLSSCDLSLSLALFGAETEGGNGNYSYFWRGLDAGSRPFMIIIPFPPSLQFSNTSTAVSPFYNNTMPDGYYDIRLVITDGNGCADSSEITINSTGAIFNNQTLRYSEACEGEIKTYSVIYKKDATYSWSVTNGTILSSDPDTSRIGVRWNLGVVQGRIVTTIQEPNFSFPGGQCSSSVIDTVTLTPIPTPEFNPTTNVCSNSVNTYTLTSTYAYQSWTVTGGVIIAGGKATDNFVTVRWGSGPAGSVSVSVGNNSACTGSVAMSVSISNLSGTITSVTDITCNGGSGGSVTAAALSGTGVAPYSYSLDGGTYQSSGTFTGIPIGNHTVRIRDAWLCTVDLPFVINQPEPVSGSVTSQTNISCFGGSNGSVTIAASGGSPPYQYSLNGGAFQSSNVFSGLSAGSYTVTIRDNNACTGNVPFTITQPPTPLTGSVSVTNVSCLGQSTGRIDLTVSGGSVPYTFLWNNGATVEDLINIAAGNYTVEITDASGCKITIPATVSQPVSALSGTASVINVLCFGETTGSVDLTVSGGTPPYSFLWNNGATTEDIQNIPAGSYSLVITDSNGCIFNLAASVTQPSAAVGGVITDQHDVSCLGGNDGSVSVTGTGGVAPYQYQLEAGAFQPSGTFGSLTAGTYNITIRDANLCTFILQITITQPALVLTGSIAATNIDCFGNNSGACNLTVNGGVSPYTYLWNNGATTEDISNLPSGDYSVTVTDSRGCSIVVNASLTQPSSALSISVTSKTDVTVYGGNDGSITVAGSGGTPPYEYSIDAGPYQSSGTFGSLPAGIYSVSVRDANMCTDEVSVTITQPWIPLTANIVTQTNVSCQGRTDGSVTVAGWGGTLPYVYSIDGSPFQSSGTFNSLSAGTYTITVRDEAMDLFDVNVTIIETETMNVTVSGEDVHCYGGSTGSVTAEVTGGTEPYSFIWNTTPPQTTATATALPAGTYAVSVTDAKGCTTSNEVTILQPSVDMTVSITQVNLLCSGGTEGSATAIVTGGLAPYTYSWDTTPEQTKETATDLSAGTYTVTVTDSYGCIRTSSLNILEPQPITVESSTVSSSCPDSNDGAIALSISGGTAPYNIIWSDGVTTQNRTGIVPGTYSAVVRDQNYCAKSIIVIVDFTWNFNCLEIPQVITPNNDGYNDEWRIKNIDLYPNAEVRVYNRWGKMVFSTKNLADNPWDGRSAGKLVPTDSYHYILYLNDGSEPKSGVISVIR